MKKGILLFAATVFLTNLFARDPYERQEALDVQHYSFFIELNDTTNRIAGEAAVTILFRKSVSEFFLDFGGRTTGEGMTVTAATMSGKPVKFRHEGDRLTLSFSAPIPAGEKWTFNIRYSGTPEDGLVISKNKFGDRTFFADHWPDRGHLWLPCIDHPSDKATVEFAVIAPNHYRVVASGLLKEQKVHDKNRNFTRYIASVPIAMKVTAVGVARFSVKEETVANVPQSTWVFPQNEQAGFSDFAVGAKIFTYFNDRIGPYPYEKLAHVQSKTRWGGLENAGNIFYNESSVTGQNKSEGLIAHEVAHQWFGDAVTENDWHHVWLSEGFATAFATFYLEHAYDRRRMIEHLVKERESVVAYYKKNPNPIVDTTITDIGKVLNTNTYGKAGWVLHMLRVKIGDDAFWKGIRAFYSQYKNKNCLTSDFRAVMEKASGEHLGTFFDQWFYIGGHPKLEVSWYYERGNVFVSVAQKQPEGHLVFPLEIRLNLPSGEEVRDKINMGHGDVGLWRIKVPEKPVSLTLDPDVKLLFEGTVREGK